MLTCNFSHLGSLDRGLAKPRHLSSPLSSATLDTLEGGLENCERICISIHAHTSIRAFAASEEQKPLKIAVMHVQMCRLYFGFVVDAVNGGVC